MGNEKMFKRQDSFDTAMLIIKLYDIVIKKGDKVPISKTPTYNFGRSMKDLCGEYVEVYSDYKRGNRSIYFKNIEGYEDYNWEITDLDLERMVEEREL